MHRGLLVLNRLKRPGTLSQQQIEDALKMKVDIAIPDLPKYVENAASIGEPAALNARFNKGITALAAQAAAAFPARQLAREFSGRSEAQMEASVVVRQMNEAKAGAE